MPRSSAGLPWRQPKHEVVLLALVALAALSPVYPQSSQDPSRLCLTAALPHGRLAADRCLSDVFDRSRFGGHLYSDKAPGVSLLEVPSELVLGLGNAPERWPAFYLQLWGIRVLSVGVMFVLSAFLVARVAEGLAPGFGAGALVAFSLGTMVTPLAATGFAHVATGALALASFLSAWSRRPLVAGLAAGAAALTDYSALVVAALIGGYVAFRGGRAVLRFAAGLLPGVLLLALYDWAAFGAPWHPSYRYIDNFFAGDQSTGFFGIARPHLLETFEAFAGPSGLLVVSPVLVIATVGLVVLSRTHRPETVVAAAVALFYLLLNCSYFLPYGGWSPGPRFLVPGLPFLALGLGPGFRRLPRIAAVAATFSVASIVAVELEWASNSPMRGTVWGELARVPTQFGSSRFVHSLSPTILHVAGLGAAAGALLIVVAPAAVAVFIALRSLPWPQIRAERPLAGTRSFGALAAGFAGAYLVAAADVSAGAGYPYGNRTAGRAIEIANIETTLSPSVATIERGGHANFTVAVQSHESTTATGIVLTIKLTPGLHLDGPPAYSIGNGCSGTVEIVCVLGYLPALHMTHVYFGVEATDQTDQAVTASITSDGIPGFARPEARVHVHGSTTFLPGD